MILLYSGQTHEYAVGMRSEESKVVLGLFGAGGFGREVLPWSATALSRRELAIERDDIFFVEDEPAQEYVAGFRVLSESEFFAQDCDLRLFNVAVGDSRLRQRVSETWISKGALPISLLSESSDVSSESSIADSAILCQNTVVTANASIGNFVHLNLYSYVAHDCVVGDFVTFAPRVSCNGHVHIGDHAYLGTGAIIKPGSNGQPRHIGEGSVIGMGAVVTRDVPPNTTVVGNPARPR